ncbi:hypothetical protein TNCV_4063481 [Trichonephila clavipes]|nr:hypothetical protein TNCV_4063481 [Trichonephila clavipes]
METSVRGKVRSGYLSFQTNTSTLPIMPKRSSSRDVGTSSYRYHTATYSPASVSANRRTNDTIFVASMERCTLNLSRAQMSSCWSGVVVKRGQLKYRPRHLTMVQNYEVVSKSPGVVEKCDVNIHSLDHESSLKLQ